MIGILGGTFDPIHYGHLRPALEIQQALGLDEIRFIPLRDPPHREQPLSTPAQRLAMLRAAIKGQPGFRIDQRELEREGISYTVRTLRSLRKEAGAAPLCLLLGTDAFHGFPHWHKPEEILQLAHLVVMQRPGESQPGMTGLLGARTAESVNELRMAPGGCILFRTVSQLEISSSAIRGMIRNGLSPRYLLPDAVLEIIENQRLYRS